MGVMAYSLLMESAGFVSSTVVLPQGGQKESTYCTAEPLNPNAKKSLNPISPKP